MRMFTLLGTSWRRKAPYKEFWIMKAWTASTVSILAILAYAGPVIAEDAPAPAEAAAPAATAEPAKPAADVAPAEAKAAVAPATDQKTAGATDPEEKIICKRVEATGTRLRKGKVCKSEKYWRSIEKGAEDAMTGIERGNATGVGGESLPGG